MASPSRSERIQASLTLQAAQDAYRQSQARLRLARKRYSQARGTLRAWYRASRDRLRRQAKEYRTAERERVKRQIAQWWDELRALWAARRAKIARLGLSRIEQAKRAKDHRKAALRELAGHRTRVERTWAEHRERERSSESDDEVIANLEPHHPELVPVFREMRSRFKATPKLSRTEAVLQWAHDHPDEVMARSAVREERELAAAIAEHEAAERAAHRSSRPKVRKARQRQTASRFSEAVPF